jgi:hypothetical protein
MEKVEVYLVGLIMKSEGILPAVAATAKAGQRTRQWPFTPLRGRKGLAEERLPTKTLRPLRNQRQRNSVNPCSSVS